MVAKYPGVATTVRSAATQSLCRNALRPRTKRGRTEHEIQVQTFDGKLHLLAGLLPSWVPEGKTLAVDDAPVTTGGVISLRVEHVNAKLWRITIDPQGTFQQFVVHLPFDAGARVRIGDQGVTTSSVVHFGLDKSLTVELEQQ